MCFAIHTRLRSQRCTHFFSIHIHTISLILSNHLLSPPAAYPYIYLPVPTHSPSYSPVPIVSYPGAQNCVCRESIREPILQIPHCLLPYTSIQVFPYPTHPRSHTLNTTPIPTIPYLPPLSISNIHKRHFSFRLVLKGNVFADS